MKRRRIWCFENHHTKILMDYVQAFFEDAVFEQGYMWVFDNLIQSLCRIDMDTFEMEVISCYAGNEKFIARKIFSIQDRLYIASGQPVGILVYDREMQKWESELYLKELSGEDMGINYEVFMYEGYLYFFPNHTRKEIICFEVSSQRYTIKNIFGADTIEKIGEAFLTGISLYKATVWFVINGTAQYVKYDLIQEKSEIFQSKKLDAALGAVCFDGKNVWLTEVGCSNIICEEKQIIEVSNRQSYSRIYNDNIYIIICPQYSDKLILIEKRTFKVIEISMPFSEKEKQRSWGSNIVNCRKYSDFFFFFPHGIKALFVLDRKTLEIRRIQIKYENYVERYFEKEKDMIIESDYMALGNLLQFCSKDIHSVCEEIKNVKNVGEVIWETIS